MAGDLKLVRLAIRSVPPGRSAATIFAIAGRIMQRAGIRTTGIDPTEALLARAREMHPQGDYRLGRAETMDVDTSFDLVVSYLSLIDMPDLRRLHRGDSH
ncbi:hypothetical protein AYJ54_20055 [Bradyrhizobium centrolobii]|uniref:Methyltransferase type 11 domain-containing protein n=1 Tax=Bradyrhizobium centrolobii TaxID=1505087 RepID=A0A176YH74_9BRAD|nr:methyltransferase domain-containing protein [Bradyrhizobium centrolobii]OAF05993.1 hypothetical protein AYJ54_20055 [Bradyrhizobium centrolobii]